MYSKTKTLAGILASSVIATSAANADVFTDWTSFDSSNAGLTTIDFEGLAAPGAFTGNSDNFFSALGVDLATPDPTSTTVVSSSGGAFSFPTAALTSNAFAASIEIGFTGDVSAVGFNVAVMDFATFQPGSVTIDVFNGSTLMATQIFSTAAFSSLSSFIGFSNLGANITSILVTPVGSSFSQLAIDNLSFDSVQVVPVPTAALAGLGLLGSMGAYRRIRK
jgi:hypothetical protein